MKIVCDVSVAFLCLTTARINLVRSILEHIVAAYLESNRGLFSDEVAVNVNV